MAFFVPCSSGFQDATKEPLSARYLKIWVDTDGDGDLEDVTSYFDNNKLSGGGSGQGELGVSTKQYTVQLRNSALGLVDGDWAGRKCAIEAKVGTAEYITIFTGIVSEEGAQRDKRSVTEDTVTFTMQDASASRGMKRKAKPVNYINHKICDTATPSTSLFHKLAYQLGLADADLETATINQTKDYLPLDGKREVWQELQDLCAQYIGHMCFRYDGKLRFISRHQQGWAEPTSEWIFDADNIHPWRGKSTGISCNRCKTEFEKYENLGQRTIYKNTDEWDGTNNRNNIPVVAGAYWPGPAAEDKAQLHYKDPASGESWPIGISIQTSTIGAVGSGSDIECEGGLLTLISFNGSTSATQQNPGNSEIILRNNTGSTITIRKFELRGAPLRIRAKIVVEDIDATVTDDWEWVDKTIPGKYAVSDTQAHVSTQRWVEFGKVKRKLFDFETYWIPQIQDGAVVTFHPNDSINISAVVESYTHDCGGSPRKWKTRLSIREKESFTPSGSALVITQAQGEASTEIAEEFVTHQEAISGFDDAPSGGTKTPTQPTIALCKSSSYRSITIGWDKQLNLTNLDRYELQVSADQANWYSLRFDGVDWKAQLGGVTPWPAESIVHTLIPFGGSIEVPTALTLYYQARRVTKAEVTSNWSITASATVSPVAAGDLAAYQITAYKLDGYARGQHGVFLEVFEVAPTLWNNRNGSGTESVVADVGVCGGKAYQTAGYRWRAFHKNIPYDPSKQYRLRCRVRRTATADAAKQQFYCGIEGVRANGVTLCNTAGADSPNSQHYICANARDGSTWTLNEWQTFTGWFAGTAATGEGTEHPNGNDPAALHDNVRYIRPLFIMNHDTGPAGNVMQLDYIAIDVFDEDELYRTYAGLNVDGTVAANKVVANSIAANAVVAGKIAADAVDTAQLAAGAVTAAEIAANTITANEIAAAFLSGAFAKFTGELVVGQDYTGSPPAGAQRIVIDGNELRLDEWDGSAWVVIFRIGGDDALKWYLQARGLIKTGADISGFDIGDGAPSGAKIFDFENDYQDKAGIDSWDTKAGTRSFTINKKFGSYALTGNVGSILDSDANGIEFGNPFGIDSWLYLSTLPTGKQRLALLRTADSNTLDSGTDANFDTTDDTLATRAEKLDEARFLITYRTAAGMYAVVGMASGLTVTYGTRVQVDTSTSIFMALCVLSATKAVVYYTKSSDSKLYARVVNISGTTISSIGAEQAISTAPRLGGVAAIGAAKVLFTYQDSATTLLAIVGTVSGNTITLGSAATISTTAYNSGGVDFQSACGRLATNTAVAVWSDTLDYASGRLKAVVLSVSDTTITVNTSVLVAGATLANYAIAKALSTTKFGVVYGRSTATSSYLALATISGTTITFGTESAFAANAAVYTELIALSETVVLCACHTGATAYDLILRLATVSGTTPTWGTALTLSSVDSQSHIGLVMFDEFRAIVAYDDTTNQYGKARPLFMRGTYVELGLNSAELRMTYCNSQTGGYLVKQRTAAASAWHHVSINNDRTNTNLYFTVDGGSEVQSFSGHTQVTTACSLQLLLPEIAYAVRWDDLLLLADTYLNYSTASIAHYTKGQPWVDYTNGIDALLDLVLMAKAGGKIKALSTFEAPGLDSDWGWLFPSRKTKAADKSWSAAISNRIIYCKNLNVAASMTLTGNIIVCEGDFTIAANQILTIVRGGWNTDVGGAGGLGLVPNQSGAGLQTSGFGVWGGGNGGGQANCWGGGGSLCRAGGAGGLTAAGGVAHTGAFAIGGAGGAGWGSGPQYGGGGGAGPGGAGGGSTGAGGSGGGAIWIFVKGNFTINSGAMIACDGANGVQGGGGGAGGLVVIVVLGTFTNSGSITAKGGNGIVYGNGTGGGGGGGHIEIYADPVSTFGTLTVTGGSGYAAGGTGTTQTNDLGTNPSDSLGGLASSALAGIGLQLCPRVAI